MFTSMVGQPTILTPHDGQGELEFKEEAPTELEPQVDDEDCEACNIIMDERKWLY